MNSGIICTFCTIKKKKLKLQKLITTEADDKQ